MANEDEVCALHQYVSVQENYIDISENDRNILHMKNSQHQLIIKNITEILEYFPQTKMSTSVNDK